MFVFDTLLTVLSYSLKHWYYSILKLMLLQLIQQGLIPYREYTCGDISPNMEIFVKAV